METTTLQVPCSTTLYGLCTSTYSQCTSLFGAFGSSPWSSGQQRFANVTIKVGNLYTTQPLYTIIAQPPLVHGIIDTTTHNEGIYADAPRGVLVPGIDSLLIKIYANAGLYTLDRWGIGMSYDTSLLTFTSIVSPSLSVFAAPVVTIDSSSGTASANAGTATGATEESRSGTRIHIATVTFAINSNAAQDQLYSSAISNLRATFLVNINNNQFINDGLAHVYDVSGTNSLGTVSVQISPSPIAIGGYMAPSLPYIIIRPNGVSTGISVSGYGFKSVFGSGNVNLDPYSLTCVSNTGKISVDGSGCSILSGVSSPTSSETITVDMGEYGNYETSVRVYSPTSLRIAVDKQSIPLIPGETRRYRVFVRWGGDPLGNSQEVEVTNTPTYTVGVVCNDTSSVTILRDGFLRANSIQNTKTISLTITVTKWIQTTYSTTFQVSNPTNPQNVSMVYYRGAITWPSVTTPTLVSGNYLSQEQDSHTLLGINLQHGTIIQLSSIFSNNHSDTYAIATPAIYGEHTSLEDGYAWTGYIPTNAQYVECENMTIYGTSTYNNNYVILPRNLYLPIPMVSRVTLNAAVVILSPIGDSLILALYSVSSYTGITTTATFQDSSTMSVTSDLRTVYYVVNNTCGASVSGKNILSVSTPGVVSIRAVFRGYASQTVSFRCVTTVGITPSLLLLGGSTITPITSLKRVNCATNLFQSARAKASLLASDGNVVPISNAYVSYSTNTSAHLRLSYSTFGFSGVSPGNAFLLASLPSQLQNTVPLGVLAVQVLTTSVYPMNLQAVPLPSNTLTGIREQETTLTVHMTFSDGSLIYDILGSGWPDYPPNLFIPVLLTIVSNGPSEVGISSSGKAILLDNSEQPLTLTFNTNRVACVGIVFNSSNLVRTIPVSGNFDLSNEGDIDLGGLTGPPIPPFTSGTLGVTVSSPIHVRLRSSSATLKGFDMAILFNKTYVHIGNCSVGVNWMGDFACTVNNAEGYVEIIGADVNSQVRGANLQVAIITIIPIMSGISRITGIRNKVATSSSVNGNIPCITPTGQTNGIPYECEFVSGNVPVLVGNSVRRSTIPVLLPSSSTTTTTTTTTITQNIPHHITPDTISTTGVNSLGKTAWSSYHHPTLASFASSFASNTNLDHIPSFLQHRKLLESTPKPKTRRLLLSTLVSHFSLEATDGLKYGDANRDGSFDITDYLFAQEYFNGATTLGCPINGGASCQSRSTMTTWQRAQLHPVADPNAPTGGRDLFYLFNTMADKLRFVIGIDFMVSIDYMYIGVKLVDRTGVPPQPGFSRVLFAIKTVQTDMRFIQSTWYDTATGLLLAYGTRVPDGSGWYILNTHVSEPNTTMMGMYPISLSQYETTRMIRANEMNVGIAFSVETASYDGNWVSDPARRSPFFGINYGPYAAGFDRFSPYATVNITASDPFGFLLKIGDQITFASFIANFSNASLNDMLSRITVVDSPFIVVNPGTPGWQRPLDYYQAFLRPVIAGINTSTTLNTEASWLEYPIAGMLGPGFQVESVSVSAMELIPVSLSFWTNLSQKFDTQTERNLIVRANATMNIRLPGLTTLVNGTGALQCALIMEYIKFRLDYLSAASTDGLQKLAALYPETRNARILNGVSKVVVDLTSPRLPGGTYTVLRKRAVVVTNGGGGWNSANSRLDVNFLRGALTTSIAITFAVLVVLHVYWEYFEVFA